MFGAIDKISLIALFGEKILIDLFDKKNKIDLFYEFNNGFN